jgi:chemotaxis protein methyltransferase CheR
VNIPATVHALVTDPGYQSLKHYLIESTGLAYYEDKDSDLAARVGARLGELKLPGCDAYLDLLKDHRTGESERHLLIGQLTIGETYFFRHTEQFEAFRDVVFPDIFERNQSSRTLRIWSAGAAIGAEAYSVAILLKQYFADRLAGWNVQILATDINQAFLARGQRGQFDERALRSTPDEVKREWFSASGTSWTIRPEIGGWVTFQYHNLVEHPYPSIVHGIAALDLILCRNVMIYFDWPVIDRIIGRFHECLVDGGWLAVGHAESNPDVFRAYRTVNVPGATLYQKSGERPVEPSSSAPISATETLWRPVSSAEQPWSPPVLPPVPDSSRAGAEPRPPTPAFAGLALVRRLADEGKWTAAAHVCGELLEQDQLNPSVHFIQALILEQLKDRAGAERGFRRTLYLDRAFVLAHYHLALLLGLTDRRDSAIQSLRNVQALLSRLDGGEQIANADGLTVDDLRQLASMYLDLWLK